MTVKELERSFMNDHRELFDRGLNYIGVFFTPTCSGKEQEEITMDPIPGNDLIHVVRPFVFDQRKIPRSYEGFKVLNILGSPEDPQSNDIFSPDYWPREFHIGEDEMIYWEDADAPIRYTAFVDRCIEDLRKALGGPLMSRWDILDALTGDFQTHCTRFRQAKIERMERRKDRAVSEIGLAISVARMPRKDGVVG